MFSFVIFLLLLQQSCCTTFNWTKWSDATNVCNVGGSNYRNRTRSIIYKMPGCEGCYREQINKQQERCIENVALKKHATSSSVHDRYPLGLPGLAVDGNSNGIYDYGSCVHTDLDDNPWLKIDLDGIYTVDEVIVYNRVDCCSSRANNLQITIGMNQNGDNPICATRPNMEVAVARFKCSLLSGRYVYLKLPGIQYLHVCEVLVMATKREPTTTSPVITREATEPTMTSPVITTTARTTGKSHGGEETKLIGEARQIVMNTLITTLPYMRKEYLVRFEVKATSFIDDYFISIIHFTNQSGNDDKPGGRIPAVWFDGSTGLLYFESTVDNKIVCYETTSAFRTGEWISIEIGQTKNSTEYIYTIKINGQLLQSTVNTYPEDFPNVKVYASNNWYLALPGYIRNFSVSVYNEL